MILGKEELVSALKKDGMTIGKQANDGDNDAKEIMRCYKMWHDCPGDNMAFVLCEKAYQKWKNQSQETFISSDKNINKEIKYDILDFGIHYFHINKINKRFYI